MINSQLALMGGDSLRLFGGTFASFLFSLTTTASSNDAGPRDTGLLKGPELLVCDTGLRTVR